MRFKLLLIISVFIIFFTFSVSAALNISLSKQGSNVRTISDGELLSVGNLTIEVWDSLTGGNLIYNETFGNAIVNGSWSVMIGENSSNPLSLNYGEIYYYDYKINGNDINFTNYNGTIVGRQFFYSPLGDIGGEYISSSANLTLGQKIVFALGEIIDNIIDGWIRVDGNLNVTNNLSVGENLDVTGNLGIDENNVTSKLHVSLDQANQSWSPINTIATFEDDAFAFVDIVGDSVSGIKFSDNENHAVGGVHYDHAENLLSFLTISDEKVWIDSSGRVGIGTSTPSHKLTVVGGLNVTGTSYLGDVTLTSDDITVNSVLSKDGNLTLNNSLYITESGDVGIGTSSPLAPLHINSTTNETLLRLQDVDGACLHNPEAGSETVLCSSDEKLKEDIKNASSALEDFEDIEIKDYVVKATGENTTGVIAQEINETHPGMVHEENGELFVEQPNPWKLLKAIQELKERIDSLVGGNYSITSKAVFDEDMVGTAIVKIDETSVEINFGEDYLIEPVITVTPIGVPVKYYLDDITIKGFRIVITEPQIEDVKFNWHAFAVESEESVAENIIEEVNAIEIAALKNVPEEEVIIKNSNEESQTVEEENSSAPITGGVIGTKDSEGFLTKFVEWVKEAFV